MKELLFFPIRYLLLSEIFAVEKAAQALREAAAAAQQEQSMLSQNAAEKESFINSEIHKNDKVEEIVQSGDIKHDVSMESRPVKREIALQPTNESMHLNLQQNMPIQYPLPQTPLLPQLHTTHSLSMKPPMSLQPMEIINLQCQENFTQINQHQLKPVDSNTDISLPKNPNFQTPNILTHRSGEASTSLPTTVVRPRDIRPVKSNRRVNSIINSDGLVLGGSPASTLQSRNSDDLQAAHSLAALQKVQPLPSNMSTSITNMPMPTQVSLFSSL